MKENLYKAYTTDKELTFGLMEKKYRWENGKMVIKHGQGTFTWPDEKKICWRISK